MSAAAIVLDISTWIALLVLAFAFLLTVWRVVKGPTLPDRVVALDMLVGIVIGFIALIAIRTGFTLYIDIAIALGLVGFLATVAFARFILAGAARAPEPVAETGLEATPAKRGRKAGQTPAKTSAKTGGKIIEKTFGKTASKTAIKTAGKAGPKASAKTDRSTRSPKPGKGE